MSQAVRPQSPGPDLWVCHLGAVPYASALAVQESLRARRQAGEIPDTLLLLEHPPVYTLGRRACAQELPLGAAHHRERGIEVVEVDRGGKVTYHGPGQLVGYPIMAIADVLVHVRRMEQAIVRALEGEGLRARARTEDGADYTGVWVAERKIASIGVHVRRGVSTHGFAVNVHNDLAPFAQVIACGLPGVSMTSIELERARADASVRAPGQGCARDMECFRRRMAYEFCRVHGRRQRLLSARALGIEAAMSAPSEADAAALRSERVLAPVGA
jgi:lipoyl(octanoyl) transferase